MPQNLPNFARGRTNKEILAPFQKTCFYGGVEEPEYKKPTPIKGRGTSRNPKNRFESVCRVEEPEELGETSLPGTQIGYDRTRTILSRNDSPDIPFEFSINPYRGCEHGCVYCYARPTHEYLGLSAGIDFESRIFIKEKAADLLRTELSRPSWSVKPISVSGVTDAYQPVERQLEITRDCLKVLADFGNPVSIITKNHLVERDVDILRSLAERNLVNVTLSITTLNEDLASKLEPRASRPLRRMKAIERLAEAGIPVGINVAPIIPGLTDHEIPAILKTGAASGARFAGYTMLRLPHGVGELFESWLETHFPLQKAKVLSRIREMRGGKLYDSRFGRRMHAEGAYAKHLSDLFAVTARKFGLSFDWPVLSKTQFRVPGRTEQLELF